MKKSIQLQWRLLWSGNGFRALLMLGVLFACGTFAFYCASFYNSDITSVCPAYFYFLGSMYASPFSTILFLLFPLAVVIPFADSYYKERNQNLLPVLLMKNGRKNYYRSKLLVIFLSGALVALVPLLVNFCLNLIAFPITSPADYTNFSTGESHFFLQGVRVLFRELLMDAPYLYMLFFAGCASLFSGLVAAAVYNFSFFLKRQHLLLVCSMFLLINIVDLVSQFLNKLPFGLKNYMVAGELFLDYPNNSPDYMMLVMVLAFTLLALVPAPFAMKKLEETL